jgi:hypothetical protein
MAPEQSPELVRSQNRAHSVRTQEDDIAALDGDLEAMWLNSSFETHRSRHNVI